MFTVNIMKYILKFTLILTILTNMYYSLIRILTNIIGDETMEPNRKQLHIALIGASSAHKKASMHEFQKLNLTTGQPKVLSVLHQKEGYLQKELAARCHVEPATMTSILNNMSDKDLIYRKQVSVSGGKRAYSIYLTEKGQQVANQVQDIVNKLELQSCKGLTDDEKDTLLSLLNKLQRNLEQGQ